MGTLDTFIFVSYRDIFSTCEILYYNLKYLNKTYSISILLFLIKYEAMLSNTEI